MKNIKRARTSQYKRFLIPGVTYLRPPSAHHPLHSVPVHRLRRSFQGERDEDLEAPEVLGARRGSRPHPFTCFSFLILVHWNCPFFLAQLFGDAVLISVSRSQLRLATWPSENAKILSNIRRWSACAIKKGPVRVFYPLQREFAKKKSFAAECCHLVFFFLSGTVGLAWPAEYKKQALLASRRGFCSAPARFTARLISGGALRASGLLHPSASSQPIDETGTFKEQ
ncbi:hypothetical protein BDA96_10G201700 [Sorghum bicolor]|uniref:Uncharacterized protein n=1 Tax=Sorghum bicolor TaxID=4558 RepID=A0A921Q2U8_SORBI|nr:hypothetical protein BDA96_10G201700 [Sorghum bicolor]